MSELKGKVAIVTGGARGIGAATAQALSDEGALVVVADVLDDEGKAFASRLATGGGCARYMHLDVSDESQWERVVSDTIRELGRLDVLVNNAGIGTFPDIEQETREGWDKVVAINQTGVWLGMKHAVPPMRANGGGSIVNISSIFGAVGGFGRLDRLPRHQGRDPRDDEERRPPLREGGDPSELDPSRLRRHADGRPGQRHADRADDRPEHAAGPDGPTGRDRRGDRVRLRAEGVIHDRLRRLRRWGLDRRLARSARRDHSAGSEARGSIFDGGVVASMKRPAV
jgi:hypothetical protein